MAFVYGQWLLVAGATVVLAVKGLWAWAGLCLVVAPASIYLYVRVFPRISGAMGYGSVADEAPASTGQGSWRVTLYTGAGCPFCPIVERRLRALQPAMGYQLDVVDVTARPDLVGRKRIGAVPTLEVGNRRRSGCMTSQELAAFIEAGSLAAEPAPVA